MTWNLTVNCYIRPHPDHQQRDKCGLICQTYRQAHSGHRTTSHISMWYKGVWFGCLNGEELYLISMNKSLISFCIVINSLNSQTLDWELSCIISKHQHHTKPKLKTLFFVHSEWTQVENVVLSSWEPLPIKEWWNREQLLISTKFQRAKKYRRRVLM